MQSKYSFYCIDFLDLFTRLVQNPANFKTFLRMKKFFYNPLMNFEALKWRKEQEIFLCLNLALVV